MRSKKSHFFDGNSRWEQKNRDFLMEIGKNRFSNPLESQKHPFSAFPTPWKVRITRFLLFQPLGK